MQKNRVALIKGRPLKYTVRRHPRARHWRVTVCPDKGVVVTLPPRGSLVGIEDFFLKWEDWLEENIQNEGVWDGPVIRQLATGSIILLRGEPHVLAITALPSERKRSRIQVADGIVKMELAPEEVMQPLPALVKYLKKEAKVIFLGRVGVWSEITGLMPSRVIVGERISRWGSCSSRGTLSFCYRLIMAPPDVLDAIVVHELCHLQHPNHGKKFWALVKHYNPEYEEVRNWLKENSRELKL